MTLLGAGALAGNAVTRRRLVVAAEALLLGAAAVAVYVACAGSFRDLEAATSAGLVRLFGTDRVSTGGSGSILVQASSHEVFVALITPACSALTSMLALSVLAVLAKRCPPRRRLLAAGAALAAVFAGNVVRIAASVAVGLAAGPRSLVLFHDWVGTIFSFAYTLAGYVLLLFLLLPKGGDRP